MDKYQSYLLKIISVKSYNGDGSAMMEEYCRDQAGYRGQPPIRRRVLQSFAGGCVTIKQDKDITKTRYFLDVSGSVINKMYVVKGGKECQIFGYPLTNEPYKPDGANAEADAAIGRMNGNGVNKVIRRSSQTNDDIMFRLDTDEGRKVTKNEDIPPKQRRDTVFRLLFDFADSDRISTIRIFFVNNLADPVDIEVEYLEADKDKYFEQKEKERKEDLAKKVAVSCNTGADLVNIYFNACSSDYSHSEIELFISTNGGGTEWRKIKQCNVPAEDFFVSIGGLAYGSYSFILHQYDKNGTAIFDSDRIKFSLKRPSYGGGLNAIYR